MTIAQGLHTSRRASRIVQAEIRNMSIECERVGGINLAQGVCDTALPAPVAAAAKRAIDQGANSYTRYDGIAALRAALSRKMAAHNGITADPDTDVVVSAGSTGAFYCACLALLDPGDEMVLFEPYYGYHVNTLLAVDVEPRYVNLAPPDWTFAPAALEAAITPRTRAILVNTPGNPSGKVFTAEELRWIADAARRHDLFVFTDEIYEYFVYDGRAHISPGSLPDLADRTITISGYSKTFSITGWRIGYSVCAPRWSKMIGYINDLIYVCAPAPLQWGVAAGIDALSLDYYRGLSAEYRTKRDLMCGALDRAGLTPCVPQGAYYVLADGTALPGTTSKERAMALLRQTGVASVPGEAFYASGGGDGLLRFCFAKPQDQLEDACRRLEHLHR